MKAAYRIAVVLILLVALLPLHLEAGLFDDRYPSARVIAMGGSGVAVNTGVWSAYYNPAALSRNSIRQVGTSFQRLYNVSFFRNYFGGGLYPISEKFGTVSLSLQYFGVEYEGVELSTETTLALSHGFYLLNDIQSSLSFGYSLKVYNWNLGESVEGRELGNSSTFGLDVGFQASVYSRTTIGLYFLNLNTPQLGSITKHDLPQRVVAGIAYSPYDGVTTSLDINRVIGVGETEIWAGSEFRVFDVILLRFGGTANPNRFTGGIGLEISGLQVDYGLRTHTELGETHQFGLSYTF